MPAPCTELGTELARSLAQAFDPVVFAGAELSRLLPTLDPWQEAAAQERGPGLLLLCGRQTGKSTFAATLATWQSTTRHDQLILLLSPTQRQSSELFRKTMVLFDSMATRPAIRRRTQTELELDNGSTIFSLPGANPDTIRGFSRPDLIIEDEAAFVSDRTFVASRPMLATNPTGRHILMTTPFGRRGHFHDLWNSKDPAWARLMIRSKDCPRISRDFLDGERQTLSERAYRQEYECEFLESASAVFPADWVERLVDDDARHGELMPDEVLAGEALAVVDPGPWASIGG